MPEQIFPLAFCLSGARCGKRDAAAGCIATVIDLTTCLKSATGRMCCAVRWKQVDAKRSIYLFVYGMNAPFGQRSNRRCARCTRDHHLMLGQIKFTHQINDENFDFCRRIGDGVVAKMI